MKAARSTGRRRICTGRKSGMRTTADRSDGAVAVIPHETIAGVPELDNQRGYWDTSGAAKTFTHPIDFTWLSGLAASARIVDYGCGYGRVTGLARQQGFRDVEGVDTSPSLIERARCSHPELGFRVLLDPPALPYPDGSVDAVLLIAVLTCVPSDAGQQQLVGELARVLRPGGLLYVSDLLLQADRRNVARYERDAAAYGTYGVFETSDGAVCRHHSAEWLHDLLRDSFAIAATREIAVQTMNANPANALQLLAKRKAEN
ncbi:class I SAM-dependent methyltransferase [Actinoplanes sp. NPDC024001]|uniref:class I SAM-dependent methyltransferase n=1 Tax=Actinoplanes sp. NPDC024001 TaxID=3154598 RepID=UPI0033DA0252